VSLVVFIELLLFELLEPSAKFDAVLAVFDNDSVEALDVPNVSAAFLVAAKVVVKPLLEELTLLAVSEAEPVNVSALLLAELLVESPAVPLPDVDGPLVVVPVSPEVAPLLADWLLDPEVALSVAVLPFEVDAA